MVVPCRSGADRTSSRPPSAASRSAMFRWPDPSGVWRASSPAPSSDTVNRKLPFSARRRMRALDALAQFADVLQRLQAAEVHRRLGVLPEAPDPVGVEPSPARATCAPARRAPRPAPGRPAAAGRCPQGQVAAGIASAPRGVGPLQLAERLPRPAAGSSSAVASRRAGA